MRFLFWNTHNNKNINQILCDIIVEQKINVAILAEYEDLTEDLISNLDLKGVEMKCYPSIGCDRLTILGTLKAVRQSRQSKYYSMQIIMIDGFYVEFIFRVKCGQMREHKYLLFSQSCTILSWPKKKVVSTKV